MATVRVADRRGVGSGVGVGVSLEHAYEDGAMGRARGGMSLAALVGDAHEDASPVVVTHRAADESGSLEPRDQAGHRALTQMGAVGELLHPVALAALLDHVVEDLEVTRTEAVLSAELPLQRAPSGGMPGEQVSPGAYHSLLVHDGDLSMRTHLMFVHKMLAH